MPRHQSIYKAPRAQPQKIGIHSLRRYGYRKDTSEYTNFVCTYKRSNKYPTRIDCWKAFKQDGNGVLIDYEPRFNNRHEMLKYENVGGGEGELDEDWMQVNQNIIEPAAEQWDGRWPGEVQAQEHQHQDLCADGGQEELLCMQCGWLIPGCICNQQAQQEVPQEQEQEQEVSQEQEQEQEHAGKFRAQPVDPPKKNRTQIRVHLKKKKALREKFLTPLLMDICTEIIRSSKTNINYNHFAV